MLHYSTIGRSCRTEIAGVKAGVREGRGKDRSAVQFAHIAQHTCEAQRRLAAQNASRTPVVNSDGRTLY